MAASPFGSLEAVVRCLPFHLNDTDEVNRCFRQWQTQADDEAGYHVDLWTYCFIRRYFLVKFAREAYGGPADLEALIEKAYRKVQSRRHTVADTARYASWVSVVCKHVFLNYRRVQTTLVSVDRDDGPQLQAEARPADHDLGMVRVGLEQAIARLPDYLRDIARLRLLDERSYEQIQVLTGKRLPIIRSYVNKAIVKIRSDKDFLSLLGRI